MRSRGSKQQIFAALNNNYGKHQSTVVESSRKINDKLLILFDFGAIGNFISPTYEHNDFDSIKLTSEIKQVVGPNVDNCIVDIGLCVTLVKVYVTSLQTYDLIICMN